MNVMDREEYLQWCKDRALVYVDAGDLRNAFLSFASDVSKHPETKDIPVQSFGFPLFLGGALDSEELMREHIEGYN